MLPLKDHLQNLRRIKNTDESRLKYLRLDKNENILPLPPAILKKMQKQITADFLASYPETVSLYKKIAKHERCSPDNVYLSSGSDGAIKSVFEAFVRPGDKVLLPSPSYAMFYVYAKMFQADLKEVFYKEDLSLDIGRLVRMIDEERPRLVCIANPNSPTGTIVERGTLRHIIEKAGAVGAVVLMDEAYYPFYPHSCASLIRRYPNLVVTRTFSKAYSLASARLGFALGHKDMIDCLLKTRPMYETNAFAVRFAEIMLDNKGFVKRSLKELAKGKRHLEKGLKKAGFTFFKSYANFVLIDLGSRQRAAAITQALKKKGLLVKDGFGGPLERCLRLNTGNVAQMRRFLKVFLAAARKK